VQANQFGAFRAAEGFPFSLLCAVARGNAQGEVEPPLRGWLNLTLCNLGVEFRVANSTLISTHGHVVRDMTMR